MKHPKSVSTPRDTRLERERLGRSDRELVRLARETLRDLREEAEQRLGIRGDDWLLGSDRILQSHHKLKQDLNEYREARRKLLSTLADEHDFVRHLWSKAL